MENRPDPTPEGALIGDTLKRSGLSTREAAKRAGMSDNRWHQIVKGYQPVGGGVFAPVRDAPADTVARMAQVVGVTPEQLAGAGREDAAAELRGLPPLQPGSGSTPESRIEALAAELAEVKRRNSDLERRFEEFLRERDERQKNQGKAS